MSETRYLQISEIVSSIKKSHDEDESEFWSLNLDQIEPHSGKVFWEKLNFNEIGSSTHFFSRNTVLYSKLRPYLNKVVLTDRDGYATTELVALRCDEKIAHPAYVAHFLRSPRFLKFAENQVAGAKMPRMVMSEFWKYKIPLPSLAEQRRIAAILDKAEALHTKRHEAIAKLDQLLQSVFLEMFDVDKSWRIQTIGEMANVQGGLQLSGARSKIETLRPYLRVANVYRNKLELSEIKRMGVTESEFSRTRLKKNDLLIVEGHGNPDEIGRSAIWDGSISECTHQNHLIRCRVEDEEILPEYLNFYINSELGRSQLKRSSNTTSGLNTISVSKVREVRVPVPPREIQKKWQAVQRNIDQLCEAHERQLSVSEDLKSSLQNQYFR